MSIGAFVDAVGNLVSAGALISGTVGVANSILNITSGVVLNIVISICVLTDGREVNTFTGEIIGSFLPRATTGIIRRVDRRAFVSFAQFVNNRLARTVVLNILYCVKVLVFHFPGTTVVSVVVYVATLMPVINT